LLQDRVYSSYGEAQKIAAINRGLIQIFTHKETGVEALKSKCSSSVAFSAHQKERVMQKRGLGVTGNDPHATVLDVRHTFKISTMGELLYKIDADQVYLTGTRHRYTTMSMVTVNFTHKAWQAKHSRITFTTSPSFYVTTTFSKSLSNLMALLRPSRDSSYYVSGRILGTYTAMNEETH